MPSVLIFLIKHRPDPGAIHAGSRMLGLRDAMMKMGKNELPANHRPCMPRRGVPAVSGRQQPWLSGLHRLYWHSSRQGSLARSCRPADLHCLCLDQRPDRLRIQHESESLALLCADYCRHCLPASGKPSTNTVLWKPFQRSVLRSHLCDKTVNASSYRNLNPFLSTAV